MIRVQREDFDVGAEVAALTRGNHDIGGLAVFVGLVRDRAGEEALGAMTLEHYPGMTEKALADRNALGVAVNQEYARPEDPVGPDDEVALFPPVTGG